MKVKINHQTNSSERDDACERSHKAPLGMLNLSCNLSRGKRSMSADEAIRYSAVADAYMRERYGL